MLERERKQRQEVEKSRRKFEGELKVAHENYEEIVRQKHDVELALKRYVMLRVP